MAGIQDIKNEPLAAEVECLASCSVSSMNIIARQGEIRTVDLDTARYLLSTGKFIIKSYQYSSEPLAPSSSQAEEEVGVVELEEVEDSTALVLTDELVEDAAPKRRSKKGD